MEVSSKSFRDRNRRAQTGSGARANSKSAQLAPASGTPGGRDPYLKFIRTAIERAITPNAAWYCWHASARQAMLESVWNEVGAFAHQQLIWAKSRPVLTYSVYMWAHEPCLFGWVRGQKPLIERGREGAYPSSV